MNSPVLYRVNTPTVVSEFFDNEVILVNMTRGHYYSLRDTAATLWQGIHAGMPTAALPGLLTDWYVVEEVVAEAAVQLFLQDALAQALLVPTDQPLPITTLPAPAGRRPFSQPMLETFTDMADLLTLDPIHDVDPQQGWPIQK